MKKNTLYKFLFLALVLIISSCKKDAASTDNNSYIKFNLNGKSITYKALGELGPDNFDATKTDLVINGNSDDSKNNFSLSVQVDGPKLSTGIYSSDQYFITADYMLTVDPSTIKDYGIDDAIGKDPSKYTVNITSITSTQIKGTFTGNYLYDSFNSDDPDGGIVYITNGEFQVKRIN